MSIIHFLRSKLGEYVTWSIQVTMSSALIGVCIGGVLIPGVVQAAQCPNEAVRLQQGSGGLPECRGYELTSRFSKQGHGIQQYERNFNVSGYLAAVAEDGDRMGVESGGAGLGVLGQESDASGGDYMFLRRDKRSGWSAEFLNPPQSQFSDQEDIASDANTGTSLWLLHTPNTGLYAGGLYVRSSTGQFGLIGSESPSGAPEPASLRMDEELGRERATDGVVGASKEFTHVVLQANTSLGGRYLWPGDSTFISGATFSSSNLGSLYEYAGEASPGEEDRAPVLVGVKGGAGNTELIGECGTTLGTLRGKRTGAERKHAPHEISENGDVVFFAPVAADVEYESCPKAQPAAQELYARIDQMESSDISEPSPNECGADLECAANAALPADAEFEMASTDGSRVFFTSTQQLLPGASEDPEASDSARVGCWKTTGAGGCDLYEYDFARPSKERLKLVSTGGPHGAEVQRVIAGSNDGSRVYFVAKGDLTGTEQNGAGKAAVEGEYNLYVYEPNPENPGEQVVAFIATLSPEDAGSLWEAAEEPEEQVTPNGDFLVFKSHEKLTKDDKSEAPQLFEYDALTKALVRVSVSEKVEGQSYGKDGDVENPEESPEFNSTGSVSSGGKVVVFGSRAALSPRASVASSLRCPSVYEYSSGQSQSIVEGGVHLVSDGEDIVQGNGKACGARGFTVDGSGEDIWFKTSDPLTWEDGDTLPDIYDARVDGGMLPPPQAVGCIGSGCQQSSMPPLAEGALASELARSGENVTAATPPPTTVVKPKAKPKALTQTQKLAKALKACRGNKSRKKRSRRSTCEKQAKKLYGRGK